MTVEELILQLNQLPLDAEVCVDNDPIRYLDMMPHYYDGRLSFVNRDDKEKPIKCGWRNNGSKVKLICDSVEDAILDNPEIEVDLGSRKNEEWVKPWIEKKRIEGQDLQQKIKERREEAENRKKE